ncbi:nucleoside hydrolase [Kribbella sp. WER1]
MRIGRTVLGGLVALAMLATGPKLLASATVTASVITSRGPARTAAYPPNGTTKLTLPVPTGTKPGDLLIASLGFGRTGATTQPVLSPPVGWTLVVRTNSRVVDALAVYRHVFVAGEKSYTWMSTVAVGGVASIAAFAGADPRRPVEIAAGVAVTGPTQRIATTRVTTTTKNTELVAAYYAYNAANRKATWTAPTGMAKLADAAYAARSATLAAGAQTAAGSSGAKTATASVAESRALAVLVALRSPVPPPAGPVRLIVDTDIFSDADDAGAVATALALQRAGEAQVLAVMVNTRTSRPAVAVDSWRCAAALTRYYGSSSTVIGSAQPANGTDVNNPDWAGPCAATTGTVPAPADAVTAYRQVLAAQPDGSVVIASTGYLGNLARLLASPPDAYSPLNGTELVAQKVSRLVSMAGGYPSRNGENNIVGDVASAQTVAKKWPTELEWDGYEVGDAVHTGSTVSTTQPATSPLRVAYEAFVKPGNWIYSYDLVAVYRAVRPADQSMSRSGPGQNVISNSGANSFTPSLLGKQYYLKLVDATALDSAIDALLDSVPPSKGPSDDFSSGAVGPGWVVGQNGSTVGVVNGQLAITHPAGAWTTGSVQTATTYDQTGRSVQVQLVRPANGGAGGTAYGETSVIIRQDATHYAELFVAGGSLTAWYNSGSGEVNLTPSWPRYSATSQQWLRFREAEGKLYWEYSASVSGPWTTLASIQNPFLMTGVRFQMIAGSNNTVDDPAYFDNVSTY